MQKTVFTFFMINCLLLSGFVGAQTLNTAMPQTDASWRSINALAQDGTYTYVGGNFSNLGSVAVNNLARFNTATGVVDAAWKPEPSGGPFSTNINAIAISGSDIYVGGDFTNIGGATRNRVAKLNNTNGDADATWNPNSTGTVYALVGDGNDIYVGGSFTNIGGAVRNKFAKLNNTNGNADAWNPNPDNVVNAIAVNSNSVYIGGEFLNIAGTSRRCLAKFDKTTGAIDATWDPNIGNAIEGGYVSVITLSGSDIYIGGRFSKVNAVGTIRNSLAKLNNTDGSATTWDPNAISFSFFPSTTIDIFSITVNAGDVYVGGTFGSISGHAISYCAKLNNSSGSADASWNPTPDNRVSAIVINGTNAILGGKFNTISSQARNCLAVLSSAVSAPAVPVSPWSVIVSFGLIIFFAFVRTYYYK